MSQSLFLLHPYLLHILAYSATIYRDVSYGKKRDRRFHGLMEMISLPNDGVRFGVWG